VPATSTDIAAATRPHVVAIWDSATIKARYPTRARDGGESVRTGYCDAIADAQTLVTAQGALIGVERRRFVVKLDGLHWLDPTSGIPSVTIVDAEQGGLNGVFMVTRCAVDLDDESTLLELFG
jgi:hypothetical protein